MTQQLNLDFLGYDWETDYLLLCKKVISEGIPQDTRVGPACVLFGETLRITVPEGKFPLLTTRQMWIKPILGELAAFLKGATTVQEFTDQGCNYWTANAANWSRNKGEPFTKLRVGRIYGAQWLNFNGVNQLEQVRRQLISDSTSRRIILSCWNPTELEDMCLPPCHIIAQFHVEGGSLLHCSVYMRSVDLALGLPSDVALYYALMIILAQEAVLKPGTLYFHFGNAHVYELHVPQLEEQVRRTPHDVPSYDFFPFPWPFTKAHIRLDMESYIHDERIDYELFI